MTDSILITGSNRGIGLELTRQYADGGWRVFACCRAPDQAEQLVALQQQYDNISLHALDVTDGERIRVLADELKGQPVDILLNNAGVYGPYDARFGNTDEQSWLQCMRINCIAPMNIMQAFVDHVSASRHKTMAAMSSKMASMADNSSGGSYIYRSSKAALNAVMKSAAIDLRPLGIKVAILHPGWVKTDMGGPNAEISVQECADKLRSNLEKLTLDNSGEFLDIDGSIIPW